ncbi:hypothetical protein P171DRAFT_490753 [Karstenula rhodostoma CBS 690.94]|uniref:Fungal N-terminal domain-containing protein n=1 Tax=Karstenula rhodostoma CBS 690.94 TaxID=1392251 RepID=A0A9P4P5E8_9PLEO|nr:hypothetical protein P171DRAFT_490753 [Karstenula rhodostoma CBS 690.94]
MIDPFSVAGLLASIIQIADALTRLSLEFERCLHTVRHAPQEVKSFHRDLSNFSASLHWFYEISESCLRDLEQSPKRKARRRHISGVIKECEVVEEGFHALLSRFIGKSTQLPGISSPVDRLRWYFRKPSVVGLKLSLESAKSTVELFMLLYICEDLQKKIQALQEARVEIPDDLKRRFDSLERQVMQQVNTTEDNYKRLTEHLERMPYSYHVLIPGMQSILVENRALERNATRSLRKENRKVWQGLSSARQPQTSQRRNPSPGPMSSVPGPRTPRPSPPAPNGVRVISTETPDPALRVSKELPKYFQSANPQPSVRPRGVEAVETSTTAQIDPIPSITSKRRSPITRSPKVPPINTNGSTIHKNAKETPESFVQRRPEASGSFIPSSHRQAYIVRSSSSSPKKGSPPVDRDSPASHSSEGNKQQQGIVKTEVEHIEGGKRSSIAGASPYRALPPFLDEDWKGVRRRPSS